MGIWHGRVVLVTGAGGFIGSHLTEELVRQGAQVRALIRYNSAGRRGFLDDLTADVQAAIQVHACTVEDPFAVAKAVHGTDTVFHLAALIGIPYSYVAPHHYVHTNVNGTLNVLEACLRAGVRRLVHTSTSETYGSAQYTPIDEKHPLVGQSPYSASKIGADQMAIAYHRSFALPVTVLRPFNTFGPRQSARAIVPTILTQLLVGTDPILVGSVEPQRDLNYVADTVAGFVQIANCEAAIGEVVNIGSGQTQSIGDLIDLIGRLLGRQIRVRSEDQRIRPANSEVQVLLADTHKAQQLFGYAPQVGLEQGLLLTYAYLQRHLDRYRPADYLV
ncbi:MAG: SDR family NAD(P)-dependent oxidoreductase [Myxococcales bacterium]|nr:SDR family NAD(P)-dependent oxidoreductase [Myxococcales bacterium]